MAKGAEAFRTISEAASELGVAQHVLRFWETKFPFIQPMKRAGGRRFYRPNDLALLATVRRLLHQEGYTIKGVQKLYRETGLKPGASAAPAAPAAAVPSAGAPPAASDPASALAQLEAAKARLDRALGRS